MVLKKHFETIYTLNNPKILDALAENPVDVAML